MGSRVLKLLNQSIVLLVVVVFCLIACLSPVANAEFDNGLLYPFYDPLSGCGDSLPSASTAGGNIFIVGDSLTVGMQDPGGLSEKLQTKGWVVKGIEATEGDTVAKALPKVDQNEGAIRDSNVVAIALGTNPEGGFDAKVTEMVEKIKTLSPSIKIFWMNAYSTSNGYDETNAVLAAQSGPLGYQVIDWKAEAIASPETYPFAGDGIHHNNTGYAAKSDFYVRSLGTANTTLGPGGQLQGTIELVGANNKEKVWNFFRAVDLSPEQAAGVMGNLQVESGYDPFNQQNGSTWPTDGWGIAQWTAGRRITLRDTLIAEIGEKYYVPTEEAGGMVGTPEEDRLLAFQLQYLYNESNARDSRTYPGISEWAGLKRETDPRNAATYWEANFERPLHPGQAVRENAAVAIKDELQNLGTSGLRRSGDSCTSGGVGPTTTAGASEDQDTSSMTCPSGTEDAGIEQDYGQGRVPTVKLRLCNIKGVTQVNASIASAALAMLTAAESSGYVLTGDSWRSYDEQASLRSTNGCPDIDVSPSSACRVPTARPGFGTHEVGLAIDFENMCFPASTCPSSPAWRWLMDNAAQFGFKKFSEEAWHWSPSGT